MSAAIAEVFIKKFKFNRIISNGAFSSTNLWISKRFIVFHRCLDGGTNEPRCLEEKDGNIDLATFLQFLSDNFLLLLWI